MAKRRFNPYRLSAGDKRAIKAFTKKRSEVGGKLLTTDGHKLQKMGLGGEVVAVWRFGKIVITSTESVKSDETILRALRKEAPRNLLAKQNPKRAPARRNPLTKRESESLLREAKGHRQRFRVHGANAAELAQRGLHTESAVQEHLAGYEDGVASGMRHAVKRHGKQPKKNPTTPLRGGRRGKRGGTVKSADRFEHLRVRSPSAFKKMPSLKTIPWMFNSEADRAYVKKLLGLRTIPKGTKTISGSFKPGAKKHRVPGTRVKYLGTGIQSVLIPIRGGKKSKSPRGTKRKAKKTAREIVKRARRKNPQMMTPFGRLPKNALIQHSTGRWGFVGSVSGVLAYTTKDGKTPTEKQLKDAQQVGPRIAGLKSRSWATKAAAMAALKKVERSRTNPLRLNVAIPRRANPGRLAILANPLTKNELHALLSDADGFRKTYRREMERGTAQSKDRARIATAKAEILEHWAYFLQTVPKGARRQSVEQLRTRANPGRLAILANPHLPKAVEDCAKRLRGEKRKRFLSYYASLKPADQRRLVKGLELYRRRHKVACSSFELKKVQGTRVKVEVGVGRAEAIEYHTNKGYKGSSNKGTPFRHEFENGQHVVSDENGRRLEVVDCKGAKRKTVTTDWIYN